MPRPYWEIVSACWVAFWAYWTLSARGLRPPRRRVSLTFTILNTALLYAGFVLVLVGRLDVRPLSIRFVPDASWVDAVGTALALAGVALAIWSRRVLGANWSGAVRIVECQHLVRTGPYAFVRNPIYSGMSLAVLGTATVAGTLGALVGFFLVLTALWHKARVEERVLLAEFGEEYAAYRREVKSLIPFVV
jgi:protein-S-isoprenylcysteine O-methyltransferase Ste14